MAVVQYKNRFRRSESPRCIGQSSASRWRCSVNRRMATLPVSFTGASSSRVTSWNRSRITNECRSIMTVLFIRITSHVCGTVAVIVVRRGARFTRWSDL